LKSIIPYLSLLASWESPILLIEKSVSSANGSAAITHPTTAHHTNQRNEQPGPSHAHRVTQGDAAALSVHLAEGDLEFMVAADDLGPKRLLDFLAASRSGP